MANSGFCNKCKKLVSATTTERAGKVYLAKQCPECGPTETLIASDASRYQSKHALDNEYEYGVCRLNCLECKHDKQPNIVFIDITNRCNMNCPICINNTPSMGFLFEPPLSYFEKIFDHLAEYDPKPSCQLFGGEPTVREDLFEIIRMAKARGISARVVTNGIKLADEEYCRALVATRATILIAYDGANPEVYRILRGNAKFLALKQKAIENIARTPKAKTVLMSLVGKGFNDQDLGELFDYVHERRGFIRGIYFLPLAHTWKQEDFDLEPERITSEDIEEAVDATFPEDSIEFIPAGFLGQLPNIMKYLKIKPLPFVGAHPNCESMYLLASDGTRFFPVDRYFKIPLTELCHRLLEIERRLERKRQAVKKSTLGLKTLRMRLRAGAAVGWALLRAAYVGRFFKGGNPLSKLYHMLALPLSFAVGTRSKVALARHTTAQVVLQLIILPFEDADTLETDRMERCPSAFAFYDPEADAVKMVPVCAWGLHQKATLKRITDYYKAQPEGA